MAQAALQGFDSFDALFQRLQLGLQGLAAALQQGVHGIQAVGGPGKLLQGHRQALHLAQLHQADQVVARIVPVFAARPPVRVKQAHLLIVADGLLGKTGKFAELPDLDPIHAPYRPLLPIPPGFARLPIFSYSITRDFSSGKTGLASGYRRD